MNKVQHLDGTVLDGRNKFGQCLGKFIICIIEFSYCWFNVGVYFSSFSRSFIHFPTICAYSSLNQIVQEQHKKTNAAEFCF